jgi:hypothetical protein
MFHAKPALSFPHVTLPEMCVPFARHVPLYAPRGVEVHSSPARCDCHLMLSNSTTINETTYDQEFE